MSNLKCPRCDSRSTHFGDLLYHCDDCGEMFERYLCSELPVLVKQGYCSGKPHGMKGQVRYKVTVWSHPIEGDRYCYAISLAGGVIAGSEIPGADTCFGCYQGPDDPLAAGLKEVQP